MDRHLLGAGSNSPFDQVKGQENTLQKRL